MKFDLDAYRALIRSKLSDGRCRHCLAVSRQAETLAVRFGADREKALAAGLLHDLTKEFTPEQHRAVFSEYGIRLTDVEKAAPKLWHAISGAAVLRHELHIEDADLLAAVRYHTTGRAGMSLLEKILYLADFTSSDRTFEGVEGLRAALAVSLESGLAAAYRFSIEELLGKNAAIHPDTVAARNELILGR